MSRGLWQMGRRLRHTVPGSVVPVLSSQGAFLRRLLTATALSVALPAALVAAPVFGNGAHPHPVNVTAQTVVLHPKAGATPPRQQSPSGAQPQTMLATPKSAPSAGPRAGQRLVSTGQLDTKAFSMLGVTWKHAPNAGDVDVRVRSRSAGDGGWSDWTDLGGASASGPGNGAPDADSAHLRDGTEPAWTGPSNGVQVKVTLESGRAPQGLQLKLIAPGHSDYDSQVGATPASSAYAAASRPHIYTRAQWGANESWRTVNCSGHPSYGSRIKMAFVHHSGKMDNGYTRAQVPGIIRGYYHYHVFGHGWCDIGYNFLVDKFGRIWEGRYGGVGRPMIGAHTGGFNTDSFGTDMIGDYISASPSKALRNSLAHLIAWKFTRNSVPPDRSVTMMAGNFHGQKWPAYQPHTFQHTISGHRDADYTECPGDAGYAALPDIRHRVEEIMPAPVTHPKLSESGSTYAVRFGLPVHPVTVTLTVTDASGAPVYGKAAKISSASATMRWNARAAPLGKYKIVLQAKSVYGTGKAWSTTVSHQCPAEPYPDVSMSNVFCGDIGWLKNQHITRGYQDGGFHPTASIIRQEMAAYLFRLSNPGVDDPACTSAPYPDVSTSSTFCGDIGWLKNQHITRGYQDGGFHPTASIARQEMAAFLHRLPT
jgi:hypothetical protein